MAFGKITLAAVTVLSLAACVQLGLQRASLETGTSYNLPPLEAASLDEWATEKTRLRDAFAEHVYGPWPDGLAITLGDTRVVDDDYLDGLGVLEETVITFGRGGGARTFHLAVAYPNMETDQPIPIIIGQTFSKNCWVFQSTALTDRDGGPCTSTRMGGAVGWLARQAVGRYFSSAPIDTYFQHGYAYANMSSAEIVPDDAADAEVVMAKLRASEGIKSTSALSLWAYGWTAAINQLERDARIDMEKVAVFGWSRQAKAALVAAAWEPRISAIISHQSGFGGAALSRSMTGERLDRVVKSYPHWFDPGLAAYADQPETLPVDQHQLLALIAPRPILLSNGRRDVWSDPNSTFVSARAADAVYELYGVVGLDQTDMQSFSPAAELSFHMTPGGHGVTPEDVDAFIAFLNAALDVD